MKLLYTLLFLQLYAALSAQTPNNKYITPDLHGENISGLFFQSPFTIQYHEAVDSQEINSITAYKRKWNGTTMSWGDTIAVFTQNIESTTGSTLATEISWTKNGNTLIPVQKIAIYNPANWVWRTKNSPDSTFWYSWDSGLNDWVIKKKIIYLKSNSYVYERLVYLDAHPIPDSIWRYEIQYTGYIIGSRQALDESGTSYEATDSLHFFSVFNDTLCKSYTHLKKINGTFERYRLNDYTHYSGYDSYIVKVHRRDSTYPTAFVFLYKYTRAVDLQHFSIATSKDTLLPNVAYLPSVGSSFFQYDSIWNIRNGFVEYRQGLSGGADSTARFTFRRDTVSGIIHQIDQEIKYGVFDDYDNQFQWLFSFVSQPVSSVNISESGVMSFHIMGSGPGSRRVQVVNDDGGQEYVFAVFDQSGKPIYQTKFSGNDLVFPVNNWASGIYIATLTTPKYRYSKQFSYIR